MRSLPNRSWRVSSYAVRAPPALGLSRQNQPDAIKDVIDQTSRCLCQETYVSHFVIDALCLIGHHNALDTSAGRNGQPRVVPAIGATNA
jgi:hypothetical protein